MVAYFVWNEDVAGSSPATLIGLTGVLDHKKTKTSFQWLIIDTIINA